MRIGGSGLVEADVQPSRGGVVRGNDIISAASEVFVSGLPFLSNLASNFTMLSIFNPAASGIQIFIDHVFFHSTQCTVVEWYSHNALLAANVAFGTARNDAAIASLAQTSTEQAVAMIGTLIGEWRRDVDSPPSLGAFTFPWWLDPGEALIIACNTTNQNGWCGFNWREV